MLELLQVPVDVIFQISHNQKPLLSKSEAHCLLTVTLLAQELDALIRLAEQAFAQQTSFRSLKEYLTNASHNPHLRSMVPALAVVTDLAPQRLLRTVQTNVDPVCQQLATSAQDLLKAAEANWNVAETIHEVSENLADEKRRLSDIQEEVANRIQHVLAPVLAHKEESTRKLASISMSEYCQRPAPPVTSQNSAPRESSQSLQDKENSPNSLPQDNEVDKQAEDERRKSPVVGESTQQGVKTLSPLSRG